MEVIRKILPEFTDIRGSITRILDDGVAIKSVLLITSKAGSVRANHYHREDAHYCYFMSGKAEWHEKPLWGDEDEEVAALEAGDMVYTPPFTIHAVRFLEDSVFFAFAIKSRAQEDYEEDTVRLRLV